MSTLFAMATHGAGQLATVALHFAASSSVVQKPHSTRETTTQIVPVQKAAMSVPQIRSEGAVMLTQSWWWSRGSDSYTRDRPFWRERPRDFGSWPWDDSGDDDSERRGTFRTMCVRLCDGFYWPISFATTPEHFDRDRHKCESSCGSPARLYVYRNPGGDIDAMEDLSGRPYSRLKTAFLYRTEYKESCKCRSDPWEQTSLDRHRVYALEAAKRKGDKTAAKELEVLYAARETERRQAEASGRAAAAAEKQAAVLAERPAQDAALQSKIDDAAESAARNRERMSLGAGSQQRSSRPSSPPARYWRDKADAAP
jgi:hypothetical protein